MRYAKQTGLNSWERSEAIPPLAEDKVREWAMNNLDDDGYRNICQKIKEKKPVKTKQEKPKLRTDFQKATNLSRMQVVTILNHLKADGKLEHTGSRKSGQWVLR